jgi:hypothetical protein
MTDSKTMYPSKKSFNHLISKSSTGCLETSLDADEAVGSFNVNDLIEDAGEIETTIDAGENDPTGADVENDPTAAAAENYPSAAGAENDPTAVDSENGPTSAVGEALRYAAARIEQSADVASHSFSENDLKAAADVALRYESVDVAGNSFSGTDLIAAAKGSGYESADLTGNSFSEHDLIATANEALGYESADVAGNSFRENDLIAAAYTAEQSADLAGNSFSETDLIAAANEAVPYVSLLDMMELGCPALLSCVEISEYLCNQFCVFNFLPSIIIHTNSNSEFECAALTTNKRSLLNESPNARIIKKKAFFKL